MSRKDKHLLRDKVWEKEKGTCRFCGKEWGALHHGWTVDHIIPRRWGGTNDLSNLRILCKKCHKQLNGKEELLNRYILAERKAFDFNDIKCLIRNFHEKRINIPQLFRANATRNKEFNPNKTIYIGELGIDKDLKCNLTL